MFVRRAGGFASSQLLKSRSGLAPGEEATINPQQNEGLKAEHVSRAAAVRDIMGVASDRGIALREVLKGGVLAGQAVYFQSRHGPILNKGVPAVDPQLFYTVALTQGSAPAGNWRTITKLDLIMSLDAT